MLKLDKDGLQTESVSQITARKNQQLKQIYGQDIDLDQESPDGQLVSTDSAIVAEMQRVIADLYNGIDPDTNTGEMQEVIGKLSGLTKLSSSQSTWDLEVETSKALTLPEQYQIKDQLSQIWLLESKVHLVAGKNNVTFTAKDWGSISGVKSGATFTQLTPELGIDSITAKVDSLIGRDGETNSEFRQRRSKSTENQSHSTTGALYAKLAQLNGVKDLVVYDNNQPTQDTVKNIEPFTKWVVIEGGTLDEIGEVMLKNHLGGAKGKVTVQYTETLTHPNGRSLTLTSDSFIDRPTYWHLHIRLTATKKQPTDNIDIEAIKNALVDKLTFNIGQSLQAGEVYPSAYIDNYNYIVSNLELSMDSRTWTDKAITAGWDGKFILDKGNISIAEA